MIDMSVANISRALPLVPPFCGTIMSTGFEMEEDEIEEQV